MNDSFLWWLFPPPETPEKKAARLTKERRENLFFGIGCIMGLFALAGTAALAVYGAFKLFS